MGLIPILEKCDPHVVKIFPVGRTRSFHALADRSPTFFGIVRTRRGPLFHRCRRQVYLSPHAASSNQ